MFGFHAGYVILPEQYGVKARLFSLSILHGKTHRRLHLLRDNLSDGLLNNRNIIAFFHHFVI